MRRLWCVTQLQYGDPDQAAGHRTLADWHGGLRLLHAAHGVASEGFDRRSRATGVVSAVLSTAVGTAIFASLSTSANPTVRIAAAAFSLFAAALCTAQLIWNYPQLAERHREAAVKYAALQRRIDTALSTAEVAGAVLDAISREWRDIEEAAPPIPSRIRRRARRSLAAAGTGTGSAEVAGATEAAAGNRTVIQQRTSV